VKELVVILAGERAGRLIQKDNGNLQFRYDDGYSGPPVSHAMPVQSEAHANALCVAVFGGLLLEGDGRAALARSLGISESNDFRLLEEVGRDVAGAIALLEVGESMPSTPAMRRIDTGELDRILRELPQRPLAADPERGVRLSLAGAQPKLPVIHDGDGFALPTNAATPTTHILKPEPVAFPGLVDNEAFCMRLAAETGLRTAEVRREQSASGLAYLVVQRYDRDLMADPVRRLHQEDFCQALGYPSSRKYQSDGGPGVREAITLLREATAVPVTELPRFWEALVFNWLIGNCDAHAKNYSLLYDGGSPTLAPLYDLVSTAVYPTLTTRMAMSIDGARDLREVSGKAWAELAGQLGFRSDFGTETARRVAARAAVAAPRVAEEQDNEIASQIAERVIEVAGALGS
jgi:serine/threonine-protein kinase HipA